MIIRKSNIHKKSLCIIALLVGLLCGFWGQAWSSDQNRPELGLHQQRLDRLFTELEDLRQLLKVPGLSAAVVRDQSVIWAKGQGFSDLENQIPATPDTPYRIASVTKTFTSTLLMQLVEQGRLDLDEPMATYSSSFKDESIKVRHVLSHTSEGTPGNRYRYRGDRFRSLSAVIEKASGRRFRELLVTNILNKLDMDSSVPGQTVLTEADTGLDDLGQAAFNRYQGVLGRLAQPYILYGSNDITPAALPPLRFSASTGLISTVMDLAKYDAALDHHLLLQHSSQERVFTPAVANDGRPLPYGLGWFVQQHRSVKLIWHYGDWWHFSALILKIPQISTTLILLANSEALSAPFGLGAGDVMRSPIACMFFRRFVVEGAIGHPLPAPRWSQTADGFAADLSTFKDRQDAYAYECEATAHTAAMRWRKQKRASTRTAIEMDPKRYHAYIGQYAFNPSVTLTVFQQGNRLYIHPIGQPTFEIFPESEGTFFAKAFEARFTFVKTDSGRVTHMMLRGRGARSVKKLERLHDNLGADLEIVSGH